MADRSRVFVDLVVVPALVGLVAEEVDLLELLVLDVPEAVRLVPPRREHVKADLPPDRVRQVEVGKLVLQQLDKGGPDLVDLVVRLEFVAFFDAGL